MYFIYSPDRDANYRQAVRDEFVAPAGIALAVALATIWALPFDGRAPQPEWVLYFAGFASAFAVIGAVNSAQTEGSKPLTA